MLWEQVWREEERNKWCGSKFVGEWRGENEEDEEREFGGKGRKSVVDNVNLCLSPFQICLSVCLPIYQSHVLNPHAASSYYYYPLLLLPLPLLSSTFSLSSPPTPTPTPPHLSPFFGSFFAPPTPHSYSYSHFLFLFSSSSPFSFFSPYSYSPFSFSILFSFTTSPTPPSYLSPPPPYSPS